MNNNEFNKIEFDTSVVFRKNQVHHTKESSDAFQMMARAIVVTTLLSTAGIANANPTVYKEAQSTTSVSLSSFNDNFIVKSSFSSDNPIKENASAVILDDEGYDEAEEILSYSHPEGKTSEVKMKITGYEKGGISLPDEFFEDFDYE